MESGIQSQFQAQQSEIQQLRQMLMENRALLDKVLSDVSQCKQEGHVSSTVENLYDARKVQRWNEPPNPTLWKINAPDLLDKKSVEDAITPWMAEANLKPGVHFKVLGGPQALSKYWTVAAQGDPLVAAKRVQKTFDLLRGEDGWREIHAVGPMQQNVRIYISPDKSAKRVATERLCKKGFLVVRDMLPRLKVHMLKAEGVICLAWKPLCRFECFEDGTWNLWWNPRMVNWSKIDKEEVLSALDGPDGSLPKDDIEWEL